MGARGTTSSAYITAQSASLVGLVITSAANSTVDLEQFILTADDTNTIANLATYNTRSNGTAATGFGSSFTFNLESSTTDDRNAARLSWSWTDATDASRTAKFTFELVGNAAALAPVAEFDMSTAAGDTRFLIYDVDNGQLERVSVGAADSGGAGFKVLRIPN
jgi:hypothetical protein